MAKQLVDLFSLVALATPREQHAITIGHGPNRKRGQMLRAAAGREPTVDVKLPRCKDCGVPGKLVDGLVIGQCGCAASPVAFASSGVPIPGGGMNGSGNFTANPPGGGNGGGGLQPCTPGCYPRSACDPDSRFMFTNYAAALRASRMRQAPYLDPYYDSIWMDTILSPITNVAAGASVDIPLEPFAGTFALFYWEIVAVDPTTRVAQVDWTAGQPRVEGCPVPCGSGDVEALSELVRKVPEACCGTPLIAWLDKPSEETPLNVPFTNTQAAGALDVQVRGRGYCCSTRIC